jgi:hypothetical protein
LGNALWPEPNIGCYHLSRELSRLGNALWPERVDGAIEAFASHLGD